jgi:putative transposase
LLVDFNHSELSVPRQRELLKIQRSGLYYKPVLMDDGDLWLMKEIDRVYTTWPFYGARRIAAHLSRLHERSWNRKKIQRLMHIMEIQGVGPKPNTSKPNPNHKIYPYLLRELSIVRPEQVWSTDITYIPMHRGFMYLVAVIDWFSRYVLSWELSNTQDTAFCVEALESALLQGKPEIFNSDQGSQFTSKIFTEHLKAREIRISMDGKGRAIDSCPSEGTMYL